MEDTKHKRMKGFLLFPSRAPSILNGGASAFEMGPHVRQEIYAKRGNRLSNLSVRRNLRLVHFSSDRKICRVSYNVG